MGESPERGQEAEPSRPNKEQIESIPSQPKGNGFEGSLSQELKTLKSSLSVGDSAKTLEKSLNALTQKKYKDIQIAGQELRNYIEKSFQLLEEDLYGDRGALLSYQELVDFSVALDDIFLFFYDMEAYGKEWEDLNFYVYEKLEHAKIGFDLVRDESQLRVQLEEMEVNEDLDLIDGPSFFLNLYRLRGELETGMDAHFDFKAMEDHELLQSFQGDPFVVIHEVIQDMGRYHPGENNMASILDPKDPRGECEARTEYAFCRLQRAFKRRYPLKVQIFGGHTRLLVEIAGQDYAVESGMPPAFPEGTIIVDPAIRYFTERYLGKPIEGLYTPLKEGQKLSSLKEGSENLQKPNILGEIFLPNKALAQYSNQSPLEEKQAPEHVPYDPLYSTFSKIEALYSGNSFVQSWVNAARSHPENTGDLLRLASVVLSERAPKGQSRQKYAIVLDLFERTDPRDQQYHQSEIAFCLLMTGQYQRSNEVYFELLNGKDLLERERLDMEWNIGVNFEGLQQNEEAEYYYVKSILGERDPQIRQDRLNSLGGFYTRTWQSGKSRRLSEGKDPILPPLE